jgi:hypothetical protein
MLLLTILDADRYISIRVKIATDEVPLPAAPHILVGLLLTIFGDFYTIKF